MTQGILYKTEQNKYAVVEDKPYQVEDRIEIFDEDLNAWVSGSIAIDLYGEYYFIDDEQFMVVYLYEGLLVRS
ncbi:MAG: hypothetical protein ACRC1P_09260 [Cellulosilyticaceae bacterium]